jgi:nicotinamide riboside transporter PnuC
MSERPFIARWFLWGGALFAVIGVILWFALPIRSMFPPYLVTTLLALGYGAYCRRQERSARNEKS